MTLNDSIAYVHEELHCDAVPVKAIVEQIGTPVYIYSLPRVLKNYHRIQSAFADFDLHIHYSAKANGNLAILRTLIQAGAGVDVVSAGEMYRALKAGAKPETIVFAGVGKTIEEIRYAIEQGVGWFNIENVEECRLINELAGKRRVQVALRLNPKVTASTHPHIATGHGGAKFGLTSEIIAHLMANRWEFPQLDFAGIHLHIGSQLGNTEATQQALYKALNLIQPYSEIRTINMGGGLPTRYRADDNVSSIESFAEMLRPLLKNYTVLLEPGRSIIADAGMLVTKILYVKQQAGQTFYIVDASMSELIRPALYQAYHEIVPVKRCEEQSVTAQIVGPVCETTDVLGRDRNLPEMQPGDLLAILTTGAYGMAMASNYNARPRPAEVVVREDGVTWQIARKRETWDDLLRQEMM